MVKPPMVTFGLLMDTHLAIYTANGDGRMVYCLL